MILIKDQAEREAIQWIEEAKNVARQASCLRAKCGAVIVKDGEIIGRGFNSPVGNLETERRCNVEKRTYDQKVTDKTCCMHAEQRAIMEALRHHPDRIVDSKMYFARFYPDGRQRLMGGEIQLYCTICAKMIVDVGIAEFILPGVDGIRAYSSVECMRTAFEYGKRIAEES